MTSDFTRRTSCASQVCVRTQLRVTPSGVATNWTPKGSTVTVAWHSSASTSRMLFQSKEPANTFPWISRGMRSQSLLYKVHPCAASRGTCCLPEAGGVLGSVRLLVPYCLYPKHSSFFIIFVMETKALGRLHFKYYAKIKRTRECTARQVPTC